MCIRDRARGVADLKQERGRGQIRVLDWFRRVLASPIVVALVIGHENALWVKRYQLTFTEQQKQLSARS